MGFLFRFTYNFDVNLYLPIFIHFFGRGMGQAIIAAVEIVLVLLTEAVPHRSSDEFYWETIL